MGGSLFPPVPAMKGSLKWAAYLLATIGCFIIIGSMAQKQKEDLFFKWHPICMSLAFIFFFTFGVLSYRGGFSDSISVGRSRLSHGFFMYTGTIFAVIGLVTIMYNKNHAGHSTAVESTHAWFGAVVLCAVGVQTLFGLTKYKLIFEDISQPTILRVHGTFGAFVYIFGIVTVCLGVKRWAEISAVGENADYWVSIRDATYVISA